MNLDLLLNPIQKQAVEYNDGPTIIVAGAGSGKTRVLTYKIAYLLENGVSPSSILALTFTNKAAREMKERIEIVVGNTLTRYLWIGTFHSIFLRILRYEVESIGYLPNFTVYDTADSKSLLKSIIKELNLDNKVYTPNGMQSKISSLKNQLIFPSVYSKDIDFAQYDRRANIPNFAQVYALYCRRCKEANAMDFDDILVYTHSLLTQRDDILCKYQDQFKYILVDEYQDTNKVQHEIVTRLAAKHSRVCVVGDDAQSIYSFRGAQIDNMLHFNNIFERCKLFKLEENYRSTQTIVNAANSLISKNINQIKKNVYSNRGTGDLIDVIKAYSDYDEASQVASSIERNISKRIFDYQDIAILYRTNSQSRVLEESLRRAYIPYKIYGGLSFYQRKEIKDILAYLRLIVNPNDLESLKRVINYPTRGIGDTTLQKILTFQREHQVSMMEILNNSIAIGLPVNKSTASKLSAFSDLIAEMRETHNVSDAYATVENALLKSGMIADVNSNSDPENESRKENLQEFLNAGKEFCEKRREEGEDNISLEDFLSEISLLTDMDRESQEDRNTVSLMTIHASKGLEFSMVYIVGMEENLFPSMRVQNMRELEEERRLFYVAITRAKECCCVSYAQSRFIHGQTQLSEPSRFLSDIDPKYMNVSKLKGFETNNHNKRNVVIDPFDIEPDSSKSSYSRGKEIYTQNTTTRRLTKLTPSTASSSSTTDFKMPHVGNRVVHSRFGKGEVVALDGQGGDAKATIKFDLHGEKQLILKYARLEIVS